MTAFDVILAVIASVGLVIFAFGPAILCEVHLRTMRKDEADHRAWMKRSKAEHQAWVDTLPAYMKRALGELHDR